MSLDLRVRCTWTATFTTSAWVSNTLSKWDGKTTTVLNHTEGCGHNGLALTKEKTFLLACTDEHGAILELDMTGRQLRRWDADSNGKKFDGGINDIVVTANGARMQRCLATTRTGQLA